MKRLSPILMAWLHRISCHPGEPTARTRTALAAMKRGFVDDVVRVRRSGRELTASRARREFGPGWLCKVELTGKYALTCRGRRALECGRDGD